jgi:hypothetical protein
MRKTFTKALLATAISTISIGAHAASMESMDNVGVGLGFELISGATLELNYPINDTFQVRGSISRGLNASETQVEDGITYKAKADGGINRIAVNYHPFQGNFFLSGGYAINNFNLDVSGNGTGSVTVGSDTFNNASLNLSGGIDWSSAPTVSMGWGNSPAQGWGVMAEFGVIFTGSPDPSLAATGTYDNGGGTVDVSNDPAFQNALTAEEDKLKNDLSGADFLPILQLQVNYRF